MKTSTNCACLIFFGLLAAFRSFAGESAASTPEKKPPVAIKAESAAGASKTQERVREFNKARQDYLAKRAELYEQSKELTQQQRQEIRERLREQQEQQAQAREALRNQLRDLRDELPSHRELIDEARERAGSRPRRGD